MTNDSARELLVRRLRDEQARCLKCFHEASQGDHGGWWMAYELNRDAANTIENLLSENADGWISVEERPPTRDDADEDGHVLVAYDNIMCIRTWRVVNNWGTSSTDKTMRHAKWQPLPTPPKNGGK